MPRTKQTARKSCGVSSIPKQRSARKSTARKSCGANTQQRYNTYQAQQPSEYDDSSDPEVINIDDDSGGYFAQEAYHRSYSFYDDNNSDDGHDDDSGNHGNDNNGNQYPFYSRPKAERSPLPHHRTANEETYFVINSLVEYPGDGFHSSDSNSKPKVHGICRGRSEAFAWVERIFYTECEIGLGPEDLIDNQSAEVEEDENFNGNGGLCLTIRPPDSEEWSVWAETCKTLGPCPSN
jgi:hypothetical protein